MFIKYHQIIILGTCEIEVPFVGVAEALDRLQHFSGVSIVEIDLRNKFSCFGVPWVQGLVIVRYKSINIRVKENVVDEDLVFVVNCKA